MGVTKERSFGVALFLAMAAGCGGGSAGNNNDPYETTVRLTTRDLATGVAPDAVQTGFAGEQIPISVTLALTDLETFVRVEQESWEGNVRVVRWPSLEPTEGRWVLTSGSDGNGVVMTFTPEADLAEGWHALQVNFPAIHERAMIRRGILYSRYPVFDGWTTSRFYVGSMPIVFVGGGISVRGADETETFLEISVSEPVHPRSPLSFLSHFHVTADGASVACHTRPGEASDFGPTQPLSLIYVGCDAAPPGAHVTISLDDVFTSEGGVGLHDLEGRTPPRWELTAGESVSQEPGDGLFAATADRAAP